MYKLVMIIMVTSSTYGAVLAEDARPSQEATSSMEGLLEKAVILRDDAHEKARNSIIARLGHAGDREELLRIVADPNKDGNMRRLARVCLLRKDHPETVDAFNDALARVAVEHWRAMHSGGMPRSGYRIVVWGDPEALARDLKEHDLPSKLLPLVTALKDKGLHNEDMLAEILVWRSPESIGKQIISETASSYAFPGSRFFQNDEKRLFGGGRRNRLVAPVPSKKEHDVGMVAKAYAGQLLVLAAGSKGAACEVLAEWCRREPESCEFAIPDIESATAMAGMNEEVQSRCVKALVDCVMPASAEGTKCSAVGWLKALASDSKRVSLAARVECVKGIGRIGGQDAERALSNLSTEQNEAVAKAAKDAIKKLTEKSTGASSSVGPEGRP
jgi:hypothetical protein